jgi:oxygen-independent coproporphyrinogen-3 oxidase
MKELELYVHIPFCVRKCLYCDFLSFPADPVIRAEYLEALSEELIQKSEETKDYLVSSVFFGGGTPSLLTGEQMTDLMDLIRKLYRLAEDAEISMECNPGTATAEHLAAYRKAGINRLSIGLQSAQNSELKALGRIHTWEDFLRTYRDAVEAGFDNINADLMSALPGQTVESYRDTLEKVLDLGPELKHISAYSLILEEGTPFMDLREKGMLDLPDEDTDRELYELTGKMLEQADFLRYEISNYARPGFECRHNVGYWIRREYLGFGLGAASLFRGMRFSNTDSLAEYKKSPGRAYGEPEVLTAEEAGSEQIILGLRLIRGVSCREYRELTGQEITERYGEVIAKHEKEGLLQRIPEEEDMRLSLTARGLDLANYVMSDFV